MRRQILAMLLQAAKGRFVENLTSVVGDQNEGGIETALDPRGRCRGGRRSIPGAHEAGMARIGDNRQRSSRSNVPILIPRLYSDAPGHTPAPCLSTPMRKAGAGRRVVIQAYRGDR